MGMLDRQTRQIRAKVIPDVTRTTLQDEILMNVGFKAHVFTDGWSGYDKLSEFKNFTQNRQPHQRIRERLRPHSGVC